MPLFFKIFICFLFSLTLFLVKLKAADKIVAERAFTKTAKDKDIKWGPCPEIFPKGCEVGVLQGDPAKGRSDVYLRVPGNYVIPAHTHTSPEHMTLVSGKLEAKYLGEDAFTLKQGSYAYGPAELPHKAKCISKESCILFIGFESPIDAKAYAGTI